MLRRTITQLAHPCYQARYAELTADPHKLGGQRYTFLQEQLTEYCDLLHKYGVKQTEMERVKKLGAQLGFAFPKGKTRAMKVAEKVE